jgi:hypothetical protein
VAPTDLDAVLEHRGQVLIMEFKPEGASLPLGQRLTLKTFVGKSCDVWVCWESKDRKTVEVGAMDKHGELPFVERMPVAKLRRRVAAWYAATEEA